MLDNKNNLQLEDEEEDGNMDDTATDLTNEGQRKGFTVPIFF
jgi:hypothetical protein